MSGQPQTVSTDEMQSAYVDFTEQMKAVSDSDSKVDAFRMLNLTRVELVFLETLNRHEQGEKCPEKSLL